MKKTVLSLGAGLLSLSAVMTFTTKASALGPLDIEVGAKAGVGTAPSSDSSGTPNPLGFGLGGRAGVSIMGFYGGGNIMYYLGGSQNVPIVGSVSTHTLMYGFEGGYGISLIDILTLRAQLGIGSYDVTASAAGQSTDNSNLYLEPGITALVSLPVVGWFVGADANALLLTGAKDSNGNSTLATSFTLHGQVGYKF